MIILNAYYTLLRVTMIQQHRFSHSYSIFIMMCLVHSMGLETHVGTWVWAWWVWVWV
jgi:hypothetical protein